MGGYISEKVNKTDDLWEKIDRWAFLNNYSIKKASPDGKARQYQKRVGGGLVCFDILEEKETFEFRGFYKGGLITIGSGEPLKENSPVIPSKGGYKDFYNLIGFLKEE